MGKQLCITSVQPSSFFGALWWNLTHPREWWRGETMTASVAETPTPRRQYGWNEPIPVRETGPLRQWLEHVRDEHEPEGFYGGGGWSDGDGMGYDPYD